MRIILSLLVLWSGLLSANIQQFTLDNGLKIRVKEDHRAPIAVSMIWYDVGSADEISGVTGVSHALEHLMFKGTAKYPAGIFSKKIAAIGGQENAMTSNDYTVFYEKIAASKLALCLKLEADRMRNLQLKPNEFAHEIRVIQEERRQRTDDNPKALTFERFLATAHLSAPYQHPVIGWMGDLKQMTLQDAKNWYDTYYAPNHATLVVVGDVDAKNVYQLAKRYFGHIPGGRTLTRKAHTEPPALGEKNTRVHTHAQLPMLILGYTVPSIKSTTNPVTPVALDLIAGILDNGDAGRFGKELMQNQQIASGVETYYNRYTRYDTQFVFFGVPNKTHTLRELRTGILSEITRLKATLVSDEELQRVKTQIIAQKTFEKDAIFEQAMELGLLETLGLSLNTADEYIERINHISAEEIRKTARQYFQSMRLTEAQLIPNPAS